MCIDVKGHQERRVQALVRPPRTRLLAFLAFLPAAVVVAGLFGALHDQISYSVSEEYFTGFKFEQFGLLEASVPARLRASEVGFLASWWMGIPLGLLAGLGGFLQPTAAQMWRALLWSLPVITAFALMVALCGLLYGYSQTTSVDIADYSGWYVPERLEDMRSFLCAGYMHNAAYLGGAAAIPVAWIFHWIYRRRSIAAV